MPHLTVDQRLRLAKRGTDNPQAHEAYLRGRYYWNTFTEEGFARAIVCYQQAIALDPDYALAHAGVANYHNWLGVFSVMPFAECAAAAYEAASRAVEIDPNLAEGHTALGQAVLCRDYAWASAEHHMVRAIELDPNYSPARTWYALQLGMEGRFSEALREAHTGRDLDPLAVISRFAVVWCLYHARRYDEAWRFASATLENEPNNLMMLYASSFVLSRLGRHKESIAAAEKCVEKLGTVSHTYGRLGAALAAAGNLDEAQKALDEMERLSSRRYVSPYHLALVNAALGRVEASLDLLETAYESGDAKVLWVGVDPELEPLHGHPRFNDLLRKLDHRLLALPAISGHIGGDQESIAVLPFRVLSPPGENTGDEYLGVGLTDALITRLSNVQRLVVRPTSSVLRYQGSAIDPLVAGRDLGIDYIVDGSIRRVGNRIRVTAQLLNINEGVTRWAEHFDEDSTDVLQIEDSISEKVASALLPQLTRDEQRQLSKRGTDSSEAFEAYLRGRYHWNFYTEVGLAKALQCYQKAINLDPDYALAYTGIADYYNWLGVFGVKPFAECSAAAKQAAAKAVELDSASAEAYSALAFATVCHDFDWAVAEGQNRRAIEVNPNYATGHNWYAYHLAMEARFDEAIDQMNRTRELDPLSPAVLQALGWCYYQARRFDESLTTFRSMLEWVPDFAYGLVTLSWLLRHTGATDEAVRVAEKALTFSSGSPFYLCAVGAAYAAAGRQTEAHKVLEQLEQAGAHSYVSPYHCAMIHLHLGDRERALELLLDAYTIKDAWIVWMGVEPQWDPLRGEPVFDQILRDLRHPTLDRKPSHSAAAKKRRRKRGQHIAPITTQIAIPTPETKTGENEEARQLYTAGRYYATRRTADGLRNAIERLERAVELDPDFAVALSELADCYALLNWYVEPAPADAWERAKESALAAVEADPQLAEAHASLGFVKLHYDRDWIAAERELRKAIQLKPGNQVAHRWYAYSLSAMGRHDEAYAEIERARQISPQSAVIATAVANVLFLAGKFDECITQGRKALELDAGAVAAHTVLRWAYELKGMHNEVMAAFEQERSFAGDTPTTHAKRAHVLAAIGKHDEAKAILEEIISKRNQQWVTAYEIAIIYTLINDFENAFRWLKQAEREHAVGFTFVRVDPHLARLRTDPRFIDLMRETEKTIP